MLNFTYMRSPSVDGDGRLEVILKKKRKASCKIRRIKTASITRFNITHTCHIDIKQSNVEIDHRDIKVLHRPGELVVFYE